jgi:hypothetical protein
MYLVKYIIIFFHVEFVKFVEFVPHHSLLLKLRVFSYCCLNTGSNNLCLIYLVIQYSNIIISARTFIVIIMLRM